ncbi:MAG: hypothetical protein HKM02_00550 [Pseudomonadales bacterium]|nr:hypothetical protein [Pseudomonadales bacterium]
MKGIAFSVTMSFLILSAGCSEYQGVPREHHIHASLQDSSYISHDVVVNYLCGAEGVYRCPHRTHKHPDVLNSGLPRHAVKIKPDTVIKTTSNIYYFSSGSSYVKPGFSWGLNKSAEVVDIEASTDTNGEYYYNSILAEKRINAAIRLMGIRGQAGDIKRVRHVNCCFGRPGVLPPWWRDRYVKIEFKLKTEQGDKL